MSQKSKKKAPKSSSSSSSTTSASEAKSERRKTRTERSTTGESLEGLTEQEWERGSAAKPAELLNVDKDPNAVTVFVGPKTDLDRTERRVKHKREKEEEKGDPIIELVRRIANMVTEAREDARAEVSVTVTVKPKKRHKSKAPKEDKERSTREKD